MRIQNIILYDRQVGKGKRDQVVQKIVMIATYIDNLRPLLLHHLHQDFEEVGLLLLPTAPGFLKLPAVDYIAIQYQAVAVNMFKEIRHFFGPGMLGA